MTDLEHLKALLAKATPGPWSFGREKSGLSVAAISGKCKQVATSSWHSCSNHYPTEQETVANFEAITALRNAAPDLIARIRTLEAERDRLREAGAVMLAATSEHDDWCAGGPLYNCICDLKPARDKVRAALENRDA